MICSHLKFLVWKYLEIQIGCGIFGEVDVVYLAVFSLGWVTSRVLTKDNSSNKFKA